MAQRSIWRGAISFGLVYVPIEMLSASREQGLKLHLDSRDFSPVGYERINRAFSEADFKHANPSVKGDPDLVSVTRLRADAINAAGRGSTTPL